MVSAFWWHTVNNRYFDIVCHNAHVLVNMVYKHILLSKVLGIRVVSYDGVRLVVRAPPTVNANHYGTAFAGSIGVVLILGRLAIIRFKIASMGFGARADFEMRQAQIRSMNPECFDTMTPKRPMRWCAH